MKYVQEANAADWMARNGISWEVSWTEWTEAMYSRPEATEEIGVPAIVWPLVDPAAIYVGRIAIVCRRK